MEKKERGGLKFIEALQLMFIAFKLLGVIDWPWWLVLFPIIFSVVILLLLTLLGLILEIFDDN